MEFGLKMEFVLKWNSYLDTKWNGGRLDVVGQLNI